MSLPRVSCRAMDAARRSNTFPCIDGRYRLGNIALKTVYSSGVRSTAPDMSQRSLPSGSTSPLMNLIMGSSTSAISASVRTPGMCTYPSLSNAAIISGVTVYSSPSMPPLREDGAFGEVDADIGTRRAAREASARGIDGRFLFVTVIISGDKILSGRGVGSSQRGSPGSSHARPRRRRANRHAVARESSVRSRARGVSSADAPRFSAAGGGAEG